jgi:excisionase family DNA binding protein
MEELLSPKEVSKLLKVSKPWPYIMAKRGVLPYYKLGTVVRFKKSDVEAFLERSRVEAKERTVKKNKDKAHSSEAKRMPEICRGCFKRTDGKVDHLIYGFCETCRPRPDLLNGRRGREPHALPDYG